MLFDIKDEDLEKDLGIEIRLHRVKILDCISKLKSSETSDKENISEPKESCEDFKIEQNPIPKQLVLKSVEGPLIGQLFSLNIPQTSIGRHSANNDIIIPESYVSRKHCLITCKNGAYFIEDVGSTTGTFIMIRQNVELKMGLLFQLGISEFRVNLKSEGKFELEVYEGPSKGEICEITEEGVKIGREVDNDLAITDDSQMSSHHASIFYKDSKYWLQDTGSTNK